MPGRRKLTRRCKCKACPDQYKGDSLVINGRRLLDVRQWITSYSCKLKNVVYMIRCRRCGQKYYIGETGEKVSLRINHHRNDETGTSFDKHWRETHPEIKCYRHIEIYILTDEIEDRSIRRREEKRLRRVLRDSGVDVEHMEDILLNIYE